MTHRSPFCVGTLPDTLGTQYVSLNKYCAGAMAAPHQFKRKVRELPKVVATTLQLYSRSAESACMCRYAGH